MVSSLSDASNCATRFLFITVADITILARRLSSPNYYMPLCLILLHTFWEMLRCYQLLKLLLRSASFILKLSLALSRPPLMKSYPQPPTATYAVSFVTTIYAYYLLTSPQGTRLIAWQGQERGHRTDTSWFSTRGRNMREIYIKLSAWNIIIMKADTMFYHIPMSDFVMSPLARHRIK